MTDERPIPNEAIGLGDARDVDAMRTRGDVVPIEAVVGLTIGVEAFERMRALLSGQDDDILLAIERLLNERLGNGTTEDPHESDLGVYVEGLSVRGELGEFEVVG